MSIKVKICGIKTYEDARVSLDAGADFLGFNFVSMSKRYINPESAKVIINKLPKSISIVGVFMDAEFKDVNQLVDYVKLDYVQLHGNESPEYINKINNAGVIKTFSLPSDFNVEKTLQLMRKYSANYYLLDREKQGRGKLLNLEKVRTLSDAFPVILAGGLTIENVSHVIKIAQPQVVDVAGGVENSGKKDIDKIKKLIETVRNHG